MQNTFLFDLFSVLLDVDKITFIHFVFEKTENKYNIVNTEFNVQLTKFEKRKINFYSFFKIVKYKVKKWLKIRY